jgi:acyl-CoA reductase-like NAD-dependent aldehyde dehydrogenase
MSTELTCRSPATGAEIGRVPVTAVDLVPAIVARARQAQARWAATDLKQRRTLLAHWCKILARDTDAWADLIRDEVGKPRSEALAGDLLSTLDSIDWTVRHGAQALRARRFGPGRQRFLQISNGRLEYRPYGVVGIIGTWNYPLFLNAPVIAQALLAGNAVVWKPSELAPLSGLRLQRSLEEAGAPVGLVTAVFGGPEQGHALVKSDINKGMFTGGVINGRRVLAALAARGIPAVAELSGFDAAIVLPDAPLVSTVKALAWSAFVGAGQTCVAVKRVIVVGDPAPWAEALATLAKTLRVGDPGAGVVDIGPLISESARTKVHELVRAAVEAGAEILSGGEPATGSGWFYPPTVLKAEAKAEAALAGVFGPVVTVRGAADVETAVRAVNSSAYGLAASVWGRDVRAARKVAARIEAGTVTVNEAVSPTMHASAPFGGVKASGFGRTHGPIGLHEFSQTHVVFSRRAGGFRPHLFPYHTLPVDSFLRLYRRMFHRAK